MAQIKPSTLVNNEDKTLANLAKLSAELKNETHRGEHDLEYRNDPRRIRHPVLPSKLQIADYYALFICAFLFLPLISLTIILIPLLIFPILAIWSYTQIVPKPLQQLHRNTGLYVAELVTFFLALPALSILIIWPVFVFLINFLLALPYIIIRCRFAIVKKSFSVLRPWLSFGFWSWHSLFTALVGVVYRQGLCEFISQFTHKILIVPLIKWILIANPFLYELQENYINQWTRRLDGTQEDIVDGATTLVSCSLHQKSYRDIIDRQIFACHYPLPDNFSNANPQKKFPVTVGVQTPTGTLRRNIVLITNTETKWHNPRGPASRSTLSVWALYQVSLFWLNPHHHLTGLVEVNLTEQNEIEHPCWCITGKDSRLSPSLFDLSDCFFSFGSQAAHLVDTNYGRKRYSATSYLHSYHKDFSLHVYMT